MTKVSLIVAALVPKYGIGYKGQLPWALKEEMRYFRRITTQTADKNKKNAVVMGRKTWESIPERFRPLKGRVNVVLTRDVSSFLGRYSEEVEKHGDDVKVADALRSALQTLDMDIIEEVFVIGGAELYNDVLRTTPELVDRLLVTEVRTEKELEMDAFINIGALWRKQDPHVWKSYLASKGLANEFSQDNYEADFRFSYHIYARC
ncbi:hypothetical protein KL911_000434 [Ogataea haglerorum]|uniref:uncharacterized protein n=1 Tax=Ogataea haglerorum TaxID=1937702 RepID=UPI001C89624D|nr:uncharacterized protein KL911_000434 [Ogataea haglerorum]KAG7746216.1 hypothetical protein KL912_004476 [Ogataea haglerorum]KAG7759297.1 hypothetical protein KL911_000434 [Ogataea haglerorum]